MKLSVITPSYNQGRFIERTLRSVLDQLPPASEYVVFDGGSNDETVSILERYSDQVRWVSERDRGQTDAVNKGIRATSGEIIAWLNSDDTYLPGTLPAVMSFFDSHPEVDVLYGKAFHTREDDSIIEPYPSEPWDFERLKQTCFICQPATFFRRSVVERFGLLNEDLNYCMDYEFWLRLGLRGAKFSYYPEPLACSRFYADTKTLGARKKVHAEINTMMHQLLGKAPDRWLFNYGVVSTEESSLSRERHPRLFALAAGLRSVAAALRWNRSVSPEMWATIAQWCHWLLPWRSTASGGTASAAALKKVRESNTARLRESAGKQPDDNTQP